MTVVLTPPTAADTRSSLADWLELLTLSSSRGRTTKAALTNVLDIDEDEAAEPPAVDEETGEPLDTAILEDERTKIIDAAFEELEYRATTLGSAYPFRVDVRRLVLERIEDEVTSPCHVTYVFCLLASAIRERKLQPAKEIAPAENGIANAFQICACLAAGGYLNGDVSSFGFPRASGDGFLPALRSAFARFGMGEVRTEIPDGLPVSLKDGGIDIIAWRNHPDRMPGKIYLLGQCASGYVWHEKSVVEYIEQLHGTWFTTTPANYSLPAMFIPFTFHRDMTEDRTGPFLAAVKNRYWYEEKRYGIIFDRLRIAYFASSCIAEDYKTRYEIDGTDRITEVQTWVGNVLRLSGLEAPRG
jgi:hypothetical protein